MAKFTHLHVHTEYSLLDGLSNIKKLLTHVKELGMDSLAITDHGAMYGAIEFYKEAVKAGVKPLIGMEAYTSNVPHTERLERSRMQNFHLLLLAKDLEGYKNLMKLTSIAHLEGFYYRPRMDRETLAKYSKGLICTSSCPQGELGQALISEGVKKAKEIAKWYQEVFGKDYYLEIQKHNFEDFIPEIRDRVLKESVSRIADNEKTVTSGVIKLSRELGIPIVATNDAHYIKKEDAFAQDALVCIATGKTVGEIKRMRYIDAPTFYIKSPGEMADLFPEYPDALENTAKIAGECDLKLDLNKWFFPEYKLEKGEKDYNQALENRSWQGIEKRVEKVTNEIKERLAYELQIIKDKGYATYFLIVSDMATWATEHGIVTNTRGSAAGSLVSYALGIINLNPLDYGLPFERFLTPWRPSPPDIDFDIADDRREEVINYMIEKYGKDRVAQICTFGRMLSRAAVRDVARVLGYPYSVGDRIAKLIPPPMQGFPVTIPKALKEVPELNDLYENDEETKKVLDLAIQLEGNARHVSVHAAGVVIAPSAITDFSPIQKEGDRIITQYDMDALDPNVSPGEAVGLLKFDLLGLRNLSILGAAIDIVNKTRDLDIDLIKINLTDKKTFEMLSRGETMGVFQLGSSGMAKWVKELKPTRVEDIMAMVALYRPGPMQFIPEYISRKKDPKKVVYLDPRMKEFTSSSYGLLIYQEDCLLTAINLAGYSWEEADKFRKAIGKKIPSEMTKQYEKFVGGCVKNGMNIKKADAIFKMIEKFAAYGFNKGHSASYGRVAYWTAYMKANYPVEYMTALLTAESSDTDKISEAVNECRRMKINVLSPDINESGIDFEIVNDKSSLDGRAIRFGLSAIKNVGVAAIEAILSIRNEGPFKSFPDFLSRVDGRKVNKKVLESLIKVGALGSFGKRAALLDSLESVRSRVVKPKSEKNQPQLFSGEEIVKTQSSSTITILSNIDEFSDEELQNLERQLLGFSLSAKPVTELIGPLELSATHKIFEISPTETFGELVKVAGVISDVRIIVTKRTGAEMAFVKLYDGTGSIDLVVFPNTFKNTRDFWTEGNPILVFGKVDNRQESASIVVESIETLANLTEKKEREVFINVPEGISPEKLKNLKILFQQNPGDKEVYLVFANGTKVKIPFLIDWRPDLAQAISILLE